MSSRLTINQMDQWKKVIPTIIVQEASRTLPKFSMTLGIPKDKAKGELFNMCRNLFIPSMSQCYRFQIPHEASSEPHPQQPFQEHSSQTGSPHELSRYFSVTVSYIRPVLRDQGQERLRLTVQWQQSLDAAPGSLFNTVPPSATTIRFEILQLLLSRQMPTAVSPLSKLQYLVSDCRLLMQHMGCPRGHMDKDAHRQACSTSTE